MWTKKYPGLVALSHVMNYGCNHYKAQLGFFILVNIAKLLS